MLSLHDLKTYLYKCNTKAQEDNTENIKYTAMKLDACMPEIILHVIYKISLNVLNLDHCDHLLVFRFLSLFVYCLFFLR